MTTGAYISGAAHLLLILWVALGGIIFRDSPPEIPETTTVRLLSETDFLSLTDGRPEPDTAQDVATLQPPEVDTSVADASQGDKQPETPDRPEISPAVEPDSTPEAPDISVPNAVVADSAPDTPIAPPSEDMIALLPPTVTPGRPKDAPRVAPVPVPEAPPIAEKAPDFVMPDAPSREPTPEPEPEPDEDTTPTAPEEATTQIVTEADQQEPEGNPVPSTPPRLRPTRTETSAPDPAPQSPTVEPSQPTQTANNDPVVDPNLPVGPPLSFPEVDALVAAMEKCWSPGALSTAAASSTVTVGMKMNADGTPIASSIRMLEGNGPDDQSIKRAYETAKRAVRKCGLRGFPLPSEKYAHWAEIEITFSPDAGLLFE